MPSLPEGLRHSGTPCAQLLSVAGFLVKRERFLLVSGFILRREREVYSLQDPLTFNLQTKSVKLSHTVLVTDARTGCTKGREGGGYTYKGYTGRHIDQGVYRDIYPGRHIDQDTQGGP